MHTRPPRVRHLAGPLLLLLLPCGCGAPPPPIAGPLYVDVTEQAGIDFVHVNGAYGKMYFPETMGGGCAFLDYDGDGAQDVLLVNGTYWRRRHLEEAGSTPTMALYRNDGTGRYEDVTKAAGLDVSFYGLGVAVGDYDGDADPDVLLTGIGGNRMLRNDEGRFTDVTDASGLRGHPDDYTNSAGFFDADGDGDLDLFLCNYVHWSKRIDDRLNYRQAPIGRMYGPPAIWEGRQSQLYRNRGDGTFEDVSEAAGIHVSDERGKPVGKALGLAFADIDADGDIDVFVGNDTVRNFLFRNRGDGTFEEVGQQVGVARDPAGGETGAMGTDVGDLYNDGILVLGVGNYEASSLYVADTGGTRFMDRAPGQGMASPTRSLITFGFFFFDFDLDGHQDVFHANGGLDREGHRLSPPVPYLQPSQLFRNVEKNGKRTFELLDDETVGDLGKPAVARGAAYADIDADGDLDILVAQPGRRALLFRNDQDSGHHWLRVRLEGTGLNREAIGAWVEIDAGGRTQRRQVMPTRSYCSQVELPVTFGLGDAARVDALRVRWPDGHRTQHVVREVDRQMVIRRAP